MASRDESPGRWHGAGSMQKRSIPCTELLSNKRQFSTRYLVFTTLRAREAPGSASMTSSDVAELTQQGAATVRNQKAPKRMAESRTHPQSCNPRSAPHCCLAPAPDTRRARDWIPASRPPYLPRENRPWGIGFCLSPAFQS